MAHGQQHRQEPSNVLEMSDVLVCSCRIREELEGKGY